MSQTPEGSISTIPWRAIGSVIGAVAMLVLITLAIPKADQQIVNGTPGPVTPGTNATAAKCEQELSRILNAMRPASLGIMADPLELLDQLNGWRSDCGQKLLDAPLTTDTALLQEVLAPEELALVNNERFLPQDASHIRLCFLLQAVVKNELAREKSDRNRVIRLFNFVIKNVSPLPETTAAQFPMTPYEALLFGKGDAAHQAWLFAALLKQSRIDAVILRPAGHDESSRWLVGVIVPRVGVLLFDTHIGLMIPAMENATSNALAMTPATLDEARSNDAVFRQLDVPETPYPLHAVDLQSLNVEVIGDTSSWATRMAELQYLLPGEMNVDFYDGLADNELRQPGLWERVREAGQQAGWTAEQMHVWQFPDQQISLVEQARRTEDSELSRMLNVFTGPLVLRQDPRTGEVRQTPIEHSLHRVRIDQLLGDHAQALKDFLPIRKAGMDSQLPLNQATADYAEFWVGVSQYEQGRYEPALGTFKRYIEARPTGGIWSRDALDWMVRSLMAMQRPDQALQLLAQSPPGPRFVRDLWFVNHWVKALSVQPANSPESSSNQSAPPVNAPESETPKKSDRSAPDETEDEQPPAPPLPEPIS